VNKSDLLLRLLTLFVLVCLVALGLLIRELFW
jgi:hypothetical protein